MYFLFFPRGVFQFHVIKSQYNFSLIKEISVSVPVSVYLFAIRGTRERRKKKSLTVYTLMAWKPKRSQQAYREWAPSDK